MDIKLKKFGHNSFGKVIAFLLCAAFFIAVLIQSMAVILLINQDDGMYVDDPLDLLSSKNYTESNSFELGFYQKMLTLVDTVQWLKSEENIKMGNTIDPNELEHRKRTLFNNEFNQNFGYRYYNESYDAYVVEEGNEQIVLDYDNKDARKLFETSYAAKIKELKNQLIERDLREYRDDILYLNKIKGFSYYAENGDHVLTNLDQTKYASDDAIREFFQEQYAYRLYLKGEYFSHPQTNRIQSYWEDRIKNHLYDNSAEDSLLYMAYDDEYVKNQSALFQEIRSQIIIYIGIILFCLFMTVALFVYLLVTTGKKREDGTLILYQIDRWSTEIQLILITLILIIGGALTISAFDEFLNMVEYYGNPYSPIILAFYAIAYALAAFGLFFILSMARKIKAKRFFSDFILWRIVKSVFTTVKELYYGSNITRKVAFLLAAMCLFSASVVMMPVVLVISLLYCIKVIKQYEEIKKGVHEMKNGNLSYKIKLNGNVLGEFEGLAQDINDISEGFDVAVKQELKNQRLKTELISNVSHDIKTPLTSIITYVDLLKKEGLDSDDAPKYLEILDQKSIRLKKLTEDLFEAAKASSGDIPLDMHEVELLSLINQGLGEMNDRFEKRGLEIIIKAEKEKYYALADGQLLWRVVENLFGNIIKYAQKNSRVYIDIREEVGEELSKKTIIEIKNVSENPLNIPAEELLERFKRGDTSRSTEGSGLGLSIAKDLMQIQGADFDILIDGDLFKAILTLDSKELEMNFEG